MKPEHSESDHRKHVVEVCRRLYFRGLISAGEGNVSCRLGPRRLLITPSGSNKGFLDERDLVTITPEGEKISGRGRPSSETGMHLAVYRDRPDVMAVVHAHPPVAIAFTIAGVPMPDNLMPEAAVMLGRIAVAPYSTPGTDEVPENIVPFLPSHNVIVLARHGALTLGRDLFEAHDRLETLERVCQVAEKARLLGRCEPLTAEQVDKVLEAVKRSSGGMRED